MFQTPDKRSITIGMLPIAELPSNIDMNLQNGTITRFIQVLPVLTITKPGGSLEVDVSVVLTAENALQLNAMLVSVAESCGAAAVLVDNQYKRFASKIAARAAKADQEQNGDTPPPEAYDGSHSSVPDLDGG